MAKSKKRCSRGRTKSGRCKRKPGPKKHSKSKRSKSHRKGKVGSHARKVKAYMKKHPGVKLPQASKAVSKGKH